MSLLRTTLGDNISKPDPSHLGRSMNDYDGPFIAKAIYSALFTETLETLDPDLVPYALDAAVGALRQQTLHPSRWALYVHIGV